jgi:hypothetical protein
VCAQGHGVFVRFIVGSITDEPALDGYSAYQENKNKIGEKWGENAR